MLSREHIERQFQPMRRLVIALSFFITQAFGATYYVSSSTGSDSNSGISTSSPWKTITKVAGRSYTPGDFILFKRGDTWIGSTNFSRTLTTLSTGLSGKPITYGSYATGATPVLDGNGSLSIAVNLTKDFVTVKDLAIRNVTGALVQINASNANVSNNTLANSHNSAVRIQSGTNNVVDQNQYTTSSKTIPSALERLGLRSSRSIPAI
jgi:hypothetical protein